MRCSWTSVVLFYAAAVVGPTAQGDTARDILAATGVRGGLVIHLGCGDGRLTAALRGGEGYLVHGLDADPANVERARRQIAALGLSGVVSVDRLQGNRLPYVDNLVNLLVISDANAQLAEEEIRRVLAPGGTALWLNPKSAIQNPKFTKPWPKDIDQWTHYLHGPDNNAVAHDTVVGPPRHMQWLAAPAWTRNHHDFSRMPVAYSWIVDRPGKMMPTIAVPAALMMVYDDHAVWGVRNQGNADGKYEVFAKENRPFSAKETPLPDFRQIAADEADRCAWKNRLPVRATAMLKSGNLLFLGVTSSEIPEADPHAVYEGRSGAAVWICSQSDGSRIAQHWLQSPVVWDGMAAAHGRLYVATQDGKITCFAGGVN